MNVIPGGAQAQFNIRYNDCHTQDFAARIGRGAPTKAAGNSVNVARSTGCHRMPTCSSPQPGAFTDDLVAAIRDVTGVEPALNTLGGTSDARFITHYCPVVEFGLVGQTMHQVDERVAIADLARLTAIYRNFLDRYFA